MTNILRKRMASAKLISENVFHDLSNYKPNYRKAYIIGITPRSGSTLLCDLLVSTGVAGNPKEYFNSDYMNLPKYNQMPSLDRYVSTIINETKTENGVFGIKISFGQARPLIEKKLLKQLVPDAKVVNLFRRNIVRQATSLHIAAKTNYFHTGDNNERRDKLLSTLEFDADALFGRVKAIYQEEKGWFDYLDSSAISYMKLFYEDNIRDVDQTISSILTYIGLDASDLGKKALAESKFKKISTGMNDVLYEKYLSDERLMKRTRDLGISEERWS